MANDHFRGGADDERLFELSCGNEFPLFIFFESVMSDYRALFGKALDVLRFFFEIAQGNEERKIGVLVTRFFKFAIENALDIFPNAIAPRLDDHAAAHRRMFSEIGRFQYSFVPFGIVFFCEWV